MQQEINPLDPVPDPKPLPKPTRVALIWDGKQFAEIDPLTGECLTVGEVEEGDKSDE